MPAKAPSISPEKGWRTQADCAVAPAEAVAHAESHHPFQTIDVHLEEVE